MNKHITHKRPWRTSLLGYLGLSDLPTKVNCWYCNQDSYLLPGGKQTEQYWYCDKCENVNVKDQNGDIVDTLPVMYNASLNHPVTPIPQRHLPERRQSRTLCENCQSNQILIYQLMSEYIRDEDDPKYDYYVKTADAYKASLQEKNPLCEECQAKVENLLAEQRADLRRRRINEKLHRSLQTKSPKRPSKFQYTMQGLLWFLSHSLTVLFCILAFLYPRTQPNYTTNNQWTSIEFYKSAWSSMSTVLVDLWQRGFETNVATTLASSCGMAALTNVKDAVKTMWQSSKCIILYDRSTSEVVDDCAMAFDNISLLYIVWIISWFAIYWHPRASKTFVQDNARVRHWPTYKFIQSLLFIARLLVIPISNYAKGELVPSVYFYFSIAYTTLLIFSILFVRVAAAEWPAKRIGNLGTLKGIKRTYSNLQAFTSEKVTKINKTSAEAARYIPSDVYHSEDRFSDDDDPFMDDSVPQPEPQPEAGPESQPVEHQMYPLDNEDSEVDGIVASFNRIAV